MAQGGIPQNVFAEVVWTFSTDAPIHASPTIVNDMVIIGNGDGMVYALDKDTGERTWRFNAGGAAHASPVAGNFGEKVFVNTEKGMYALSTIDGSVEWHFEGEGE